MPPKGEIESPHKPDDKNEEILSLLDEEDADELSITSEKVKRLKILKYIRIAIFLAMWVTFTTLLIVFKENHEKMFGATVSPGPPGTIIKLSTKPEKDSISLILSGPFKYQMNEMIRRKPEHYANEGSKAHLEVSLLHKKENGEYELISPIWHVESVAKKNFDQVEMQSRKNDMILHKKVGDYYLNLVLENAEEPMPVLIRAFGIQVPSITSTVIADLIIVFLFIFLFWDLTTRTIIMLLFCTLCVAILGIYNIRPPLPDIPKYVEVDLILSLIGLTIIVGVFAETGGDLYFSVQIFRYSRGHIWPLLSVACVITFVASAFLDRFTTLVLITLFFIRYSEIQQLNAGNVLTCIMFFSNIGFMLTPSDPIRRYVLENPKIKKRISGLTGFWGFVLHMLLPVTVSAALTYIYLRLYYHSTKSMQIVEPPIVSRLKRAIRVWNRAAKSLGEYSQMEKAVQQNVKHKVDKLRDRLRRLGKMPAPIEDFNAKVKHLEERHKIKNKPQIIMCAVIIILILLMQIGYPLRLHYLSNGWTCLLFSLILLALVNWHDFESLMSMMDWSTILMITCIMIVTRALALLGIFDMMGDLLVRHLCTIDKRMRLQLSCVVLLSVSGFASCFFDTNYIYYSMASKVVDLVTFSDVNLPYEPLILAIVLGAGFGTNATLISSFTNIVCSGLSEKHGYKFYFWDFFKIGIIVTLGGIVSSIIYVSLYALIFH